MPAAEQVGEESKARESIGNSAKSEPPPGDQRVYTNSFVFLLKEQPFLRGTHTLHGRISLLSFLVVNTHLPA